MKMQKKNIRVLEVSVLLIVCLGIMLLAELFVEKMNFSQSTGDSVIYSAASSETQRNEKEHVLSGTSALDSTVTLEDLKDINYINNAVYFLNNPQHHSNTIDDAVFNSEGVCTTVAIQMLMGYHNYYSDRRLIPESFLSEGYGNYLSYPLAYSPYRDSEQGDPETGTADSFFEELYNLTTWGELPGVGQNIYSVSNAAIKFVKKHAPMLVDNVEIQAGIFSQQEAINDINNGIPVVLGYEPVFSGAESYHVVVAYGYATLDGQIGFLVHYGHGARKTQVWVPAKWFGFQVKMSVNHSHDFYDTSINFGNKEKEYTHRVMKCSICGGLNLEKLYEVNKNQLVKVNYPLVGEIIIPNNLYGETIATIGEGAFENQEAITSISFDCNVKEIKDRAFQNCTSLCSVSGQIDELITIGNNAFANCQKLDGLYALPYVEKIADGAFKNCSSLKGITELNSLQFIGMEAFYNCHNMETISLPSTVTYIGEKAFTNCVNLNMLVDNLNPGYSVENNILYNKERSEIIATGKIESNVRIPDSVAKIGPYAFAGNSNLFKVSMDQAITIALGAFSDCENLQNVSFYSMYLPKLEENAFVNCKFNLYVPYQYQEDYKNLFVEYAPNVNVDSEEVEIQFQNDGQIVATKMVPYGSLVDNATIPVKEGYTFEGWYDSNGEKYIDADGKGVKLIDQKQHLVLESHWAIKSYKIKINGNGYVTWLGPNGLSDEECEIEYGTILSSINLIAEFKATKQAYKEGSVFDHFEYNGNEMAWASIPDLGDDGMVIEIVPQWKLEKHTIHFSTGYEVPIASITSEYGAEIVVPQNLKRDGYVFKGWFVTGTENAVTWVTMPDLTPKTDQNTYLEAQNNGSVQLEARWEEIIYRINYDANGGSGSMTASELSYFSEMQLPRCTFTRYGYYFLGWSRSNNNIVEFKDKATVKKLTEQSSLTLYACWEQKKIVLTYFAGEKDNNGNINLLEGFVPFASPTVLFGETHTQTAPAYEGYTFSEWQVDSPVAYSANGASITVTCNYDPVTVNAISIIAIYTKNACVAEGSLITLADGTQKPVEDLTGEEQLLVWNIYTGQFDSAPILFIDKEPDGQYEVIHLYFSDNTEVKVISEHAFWDITLNEYVFLRKDAAQYLGHWFNKQTFDTNGNMVNASVQLMNVVVQKEYTSAWSPVTYGHLCYYVNGMLTMPGATTGLINIFEIDPETMKVDEAAYHRDIEKYGLITYEEFTAKCPLPRKIFEAFGLQNFKVAVGKGLITWEKMEKLIEIYSKFWD